VKKKLPVAIQLYSVRQELASDFRGTLQKIREIGYGAVELAFFYGGLAADELAVLLDELQLSVCGIYEQTANLCKADAEVYKYAAKLNCKYLTLGFSLKDLEERFHECQKLLRQASQTAAGHGLRVCYHAHAHEFQMPKGGRRSYLEQILQDTPNLLFEADTAWIKAGSPQSKIPDFLQQHAAIIPLLHLKDLDADGKITELGKGSIDFPAILGSLNPNIEYLIYEQDYSSIGAMQSAKVSFQYLNNLLKQQTEQGI
jgi:sugar phosphate isomerase/epimerase